MTVSTTMNKVAYIGNGVATTFAIPFPFLEQEHLKVRQLLNNVQTERTDWTISGRHMIFEAAPAENAQIVIMREVPLTQETDYRDNEILHAETLERNFDKLTMQVQQLAEKSERAVTVNIFDDTAADSLIPSIRKAVSDCQTAVETTAKDVQKTTAQTVAATASAANAAAAEANTAAMLATKAEADLSNLSAEGKRRIAALSSPSSAQIVDIFTSPITTEHQSYTAPANGTVMANIAIQNGYMTSDNINTGEGCLIGNTNGVCYSSVNIKVRKGDTVTTYTYQSSATVFHSKFVYDQGEI